jgi:histone-lysine N-methyltransferase SUV39H
VPFLKPSTLFFYCKGLYSKNLPEKGHMQVPSVMAEPSTPSLDFQYIDESIGVDVEGPRAQQAGCTCEQGCSLQGACPCCQRNPLGPLYDGEGRLIVLVHRTQMDDTIFECSPACACRARCANAITQQGTKVRLRLAQLPGKGWGVLAEQPILAGTFVCNYLGEYITTAQAQQRLQQYDASGLGHALLVSQAAKNRQS